MLKIGTPLLVLFLCLFENKLRFHNGIFAVWAAVFSIVSVLSIFYTTLNKNTLDSFLSLSFCFLMLFAVSQYIRDMKDIETVMDFLAVGGILYAAYIFINQYNTIFTESIDPKYTNQTIMSFTYIMIPTTFYLIYRLLDKKKNKIFMGLLFGFSYLMCLLSGRRKALLFPIVLIGLVLFLKNRKNNMKIILSIVLTAVMIFVVYYASMHNDVLYNIIGKRVEGLLAFAFSDDAFEVDKSAWSRQYLVVTAWGLFEHNPLLGIGLNNFKDNNILGLYAHNNYVELLCDLGIVGTIAFYWIYFYLFVQFLKVPDFWNDRLAQFLFALLAVNLMLDFGTITYYRVYFNMVICLATAYISIRHRKEKLSLTP
ncbi:MAG TPA: O-antigen ligase family protein [Desulfitobacteriaceae bacterium]|nr:O-antigen ligase family protein [Desulfitobacteriaceae bacterium]